MINIEDINCFFNKNKRNKNDEFNKKREDIICKLFNDEITEEFLNKSRRWTLIKKNINEYTKKLHPNKIENIKCKKKAGRGNHNDFNLYINRKKYKVEFKYNVNKITDAPQFSSPMEPSKYMVNNDEISYPSFFYDNYLEKITNYDGINMPDRQTYLKNIHNENPSCIEELQKKYYRGAPKSSKFTNLENDKKFYEFCKKTSEDSIKKYLEMSDLDIVGLTEYLYSTQEEKNYMLYYNNNFFLEKPNLDDFNIVSYEKDCEHYRYICKTKNKKILYVLLRWKNGNGIAFPAFQIKLKK